MARFYTFWEIKITQPGYSNKQFHNFSISQTKRVEGHFQPLSLTTRLPSSTCHRSDRNFLPSGKLSKLKISKTPVVESNTMKVIASAILFALAASPVPVVRFHSCLVVSCLNKALVISPFKCSARCPAPYDDDTPM